MNQEQILEELLQQAITCEVPELEGKIKEYILKMKDISSKEDLLQGTLQLALQSLLFTLEERAELTRSEAKLSEPLKENENANQLAEEEVKPEQSVAESGESAKEKVNPLVGATERIALKQKIRICREALLKSKHLAVSEKEKNITANDFSWGVIATEPKLVAEISTGRSYWKKFAKEAPINIPETMTFVDCGRLYWCKQMGVDINEILATETRFTVNASEGKDGTKIIDGADLIAKYKAIKAQSGDLKLFKVVVQGEKVLEYMMFLGMRDIEDVQSEKLQEFLRDIYTSETHREEILKSLKSGQCLYGGTIARNNQGKLELRFYDSDVQAVHKVNCTNGTWMPKEQLSMPRISQDVKRGNPCEITRQISARVAEIQAIKEIEKQMQSGIEH